MQGTKLPPLEQTQENQSENPTSQFEVLPETEGRISLPAPDGGGGPADVIHETGLVTRPSATTDTVEDTPVASNDTPSIQIDNSATTEIDNLSPKLVLNFPSRASNKKAFFTASLRPTLPPIDESASSRKHMANNKLEVVAQLTDSKIQSELTGLGKSSHAGEFISYQCRCQI